MGNRQNLNCIPHKILSSIPGAIMQATDKDTSFKLLKNYYTKEQKTVNLGKDFIKKSECIQDAVKSNFNHIINESITGKSENTKSALKKLIEGKIEETKIRDKFSFKQKSETKAEDIFSRGKDAEFALGRFILDSDFEGTASRYGDTITVQGILQNHIKDRYDFDKKTYTYNEYLAEKNGCGKPFEVRADWNEEVYGSAKIDRKGNITQPYLRRYMK